MKIKILKPTVTYPNFEITFELYTGLAFGIGIKFGGKPEFGILKRDLAFISIRGLLIGYLVVGFLKTK